VFADIFDNLPTLPWPTRGENMFQFLVDLLSSAYIELVILILLLIYFIIHRRDQRIRVSAIRVVRMAMFVAVFIYFMFIWASTVQPTLRSISIFGMFAINVVMLYYLMLSWLERPYRDALLAIANNPEKQDILHRIWQTGKRFYYSRYALSSIFSGTNPFSFLHFNRTCERRYSGSIAAIWVRTEIGILKHDDGIFKKST
jgi:uncharacterized membrane protein